MEFNKKIEKKWQKLEITHKRGRSLQLHCILSFWTIIFPISQSNICVRLLLQLYTQIYTYVMMK